MWIRGGLLVLPFPWRQRGRQYPQRSQDRPSVPTGAQRLPRSSSSAVPGTRAGGKRGKQRKNRKAKQPIKEQRMAEETKNSPLGSYKGNSFDRRLLLLSRVVCYATDDTNTGSSYLRCQFN